MKALAGPVRISGSFDQRQHTALAVPVAAPRYRMSGSIWEGTLSIR
jgi:hypothetical protein